MDTLWFTVYFGSIVVFIIPIMTVIAWSDTNKHTTRYERLDAWQLTTLIATLMLALYTYFFVRAGDAWLVDEATLWRFCAAGITMSFMLHVGKNRVASKQRKQERRLIAAVTKP